MFTIEVRDQEVRDALNALGARVTNPRPFLQAIGEDIMERTKRRFETGTDPAGRRWQPNAQATILAMLDQRSGAYAYFSHVGSKKTGVTRVGDKKGYYTKGGNINAREQRALLAKKVLVETGSLARQFHVAATRDSVSVGNSMAYAAIHQFGGKAGRGKKVTIPARPFLPVTPGGDLYPAEQRLILDQLNDWLAGR